MPFTYCSFDIFDILLDFLKFITDVKPQDNNGAHFIEMILKQALRLFPIGYYIHCRSCGLQGGGHPARALPKVVKIM